MKKNELEIFWNEKNKNIEEMGKDKSFFKKTIDWMVHADKYKYTYNFTWMGQPIIKTPADMVVLQEIMWQVKPDLVIETGIAHGGSIIFSASMMSMMGFDGEVVAVDIDIREHNRQLIEKHPMYGRITMYEGDSTDISVINKILIHVEGKKRVMVILDSNHAHEHVLKELEIYSKFVTQDSYIILPDTFIEFFPKGHYSKDRPWDVGNNPYTAMMSFLDTDEGSKFQVQKEWSSKAMITESFDGYLKKVVKV